MELSEAKKECKDLIEEYLSCSVIGLDMQVDVSFGQKRCEAIDTLLKALDNSISKEYHEMAIKEQSDIIDDLKTRLDNSISKDDVRKIISEIGNRLDDREFKHDIYMGTPKFYEYLSLLYGQKWLKDILGEIRR